MTKKINILAPKSGSKEITPQLDLGIAKDTDLGEIGMGVLSDGTPYLNQRVLLPYVAFKMLTSGRLAHSGMSKMKSRASRRSRRYSKRWATRLLALTSKCFTRARPTSATQQKFA